MSDNAVMPLHQAPSTKSLRTPSKSALSIAYTLQVFLFNVFLCLHDFKQSNNRFTRRSSHFHTPYSPLKKLRNVLGSVPSSPTILTEKRRFPMLRINLFRRKSAIKAHNLSQTLNSTLAIVPLVRTCLHSLPCWPKSIDFLRSAAHIPDVCCAAVLKSQCFSTQPGDCEDRF